jgi:hypothetical protein
VTDSAAEVITRPNGKPYRSRRVTAQAIGEEDEGVLVLGTHDLARAQALADQTAKRIAGSGYVAADPWRGWWRDGFENGRRSWVTDEVRGRAGVLFREIVEAPPVPEYVAPARYALTVLHRRKPDGGATIDAATAEPVNGWTACCGRPMLQSELWQPADRREGDSLCTGGESPEAAVNDIQEALL